MYLNSLRAVTDVRLFVLPADAFTYMVREWFPMAMHLLEGLYFGLQATQSVVTQRERLLALGSLTAGLTHELNNPAAAAGRAAAELPRPHRRRPHPPPAAPGQLGCRLVDAGPAGVGGPTPR